MTQTDAPCVVLHKRPAPEGMSPTAVFVYNYIDGSASWVDTRDLSARTWLPALPVLMDTPEGAAENERVFWHGGEEYRTHSLWEDGKGPWCVEHLSVDGRRTSMLNDQPSAEVARSAIASMVTSLRIIQGERPVEYIAEARDAKGDPLALDITAADDHGRLRAESERALARVLAGVNEGLRRTRTGTERGETIAFFKVYPVFAEGWIGQPAHWHPRRGLLEGQGGGSVRPHSRACS